MIDRQKKLKICLAASAGGHLSQLLKLEQCWDGQDVFFMTTSVSVNSMLSKKGKTLMVGECNRQHPLEVLRVFLRCLIFLCGNRPDVIISTGAAAGCMCCFIGKLLGAKVVWLDSIANTEKLSLSGRLVRPIANLILTQWEDVASKYKNVEYAGAII